jgi:hypothetical protein
MPGQPNEWSRRERLGEVHDRVGGLHPEDAGPLRRANDAMMAGDPGPYIEMWSRRDPVSLFGAWGPCHTGWAQLDETFRWVGSRFSDGENAGVDFDVRICEW